MVPTELLMTAMIGGFATALTAIVATVQVMGNRIDDLRVDMNQRFAGVDGQLASVDRRFTAIDGRFTAIDSRLEALHDELTTVRAALAGVDARLGTLEQR